MRRLTAKNYSINDFKPFICDTAGKTIKGKEEIVKHISTIKSRFVAYQENQLRLEHLTPIKYSINSKTKCDKLSSTEQENELYCCLYKLYDSDSEHSKAFKQSIKILSNSKCPYCSIDTPSHLDHYLPRSKFPEFSILSLNLIYVCSICNTTYKGNNYINANNERLYFNPYFDTFIDNISFLKCNIAVNDIYPEFTFYIDNALSTKHNCEYIVIKNHFDQLNLKSRYMSQIVKEKFKRFKNSYINQQTQQFKNVTIQELQDDIKYILDGLYDLNINNWEKVFFESLRNNPNCLNLIVNKQININ